MSNLIALHGTASSVVFECNEGAVPLWRHWGPRLATAFRGVESLSASRPTPSFSLDQPVHFSIFPAFGMGWFGQSALLANRNGIAFAQGFTLMSASVSDDAQGVAFVLHDKQSEISIDLSFHLDAKTDVLTVSTRLTNLGSTPLEVQWLAGACLPLPYTAKSVRSFGGRHNYEFLACEDTLGRATWQKENRRGLTSHDAIPLGVVTLASCTQHMGQAYGAQLAWSGNHRQTIEWLDDGRYQWQFGEFLAPGEILLPAGQSFGAPDVLASFSQAGLNGVAQAFHAEARSRVKWPTGKMTPRPVHLNTWEGYYFDHDLPALQRLADKAAEVGIERFVLDDGWFHRRDDDSRALGDWWPDREKYPDGLAPLAKHVVGLGMEFGLWVEPEMVNQDSDLFRHHPDWALQIAGRPHLTARNQLVLDLSRPEVGDYLFDAIAKLLRELPISYLKWDHNRDLVAAGGADGRARYHQQIIAAYALFERFRSAFPQVEIEACAGGGGRIDAGILAHTHRFWTSDCIDAVSRLAIQRGFLQFMPPELMGSHLGTAPAHSTGRSQNMDFRASVALQGHFGVELDLVKLGDKDIQKLSTWIGFYKAWRHLLHQQVWIDEGPDGLSYYASGSAEEWIVIVYRQTPMSLRHMPSLMLPFVDQSATFEVKQIAGRPQAGEQILDGSWLRSVGLTIGHMLAESAVIFHGRSI